MRLKDDVEVLGLQPEALLAIFVANSVVQSYNYEFVITSIADGKHKTNSLHYKGLAFDFRTIRLNMPYITQERIAEDLEWKLGPDYDIVIEPSHIHVEYDRKKT